MIKLGKYIKAAVLLIVLFTSAKAQANYTIEQGWIKGHNENRYNNRPLYLHNTNAFILSGDRPIARFAKENHLFGTFSFIYKHGQTLKPLHLFESIDSYYRCGEMRWTVSDSHFPGLTIYIHLLPASSGFGADYRITATGLSKGDSLQWTYGEKETRAGQNLSWQLDAMGHPDLLQWGIGSNFQPILQKTLGLNTAIYLRVMMNFSSFGLDIASGGKQLYETSASALAKFAQRLTISTPDPCLDAMAGASLAAVDGTWYPPVFVHGCLQWNNRLPGWRTQFGGTVLGWHDRIMDEARFYLPSQVKESDKTEAHADTSHLMSIQSKDSRLYGVGRLLKDQDFYDMQTQYFDQLVEEYRWNPTTELVSMLRPALSLHLKWMDECFDPDGDGIYESYINSWPTDSQWYNGGGTAEETSYAYRAYQAALDMAQNAGDTATVRQCHNKMERIRQGFFRLLWLKEQGHSGAYREQGGLARVHTDPWLYSIFLPIDAGLTSTEQGIESLYYPEWALQNDTIAGGGRMVWTSNWVPGIWSVRELWPGDNYHLSMSYFRCGMPVEGWEIMRGTMMHMGLLHTVPGNLGSPQGGVDFGDCVHPFVRCLVSGLFGYQPNYPRSEVLIAPAFPPSWKHASIRVPDFGLNFQDNGKILTYRVQLERKAIINLHIPFGYTSVRSVTVNGKPISFRILPMAGCSQMEIRTPEAIAAAQVVIRYEGTKSYSRPMRIVLPSGTQSHITLPEGNITKVYDPQSVFGKITTLKNEATFTVTGKQGYHTAIFQIKRGQNEIWKILHIQITDTKSDSLARAMNPFSSSLKGMKWTPIDLSNSFNADVRQVYRQRYLSPRPATVSVRLGTDGYSPWTFPFWGSKPPVIALDSLDRFQHDSLLEMPQGMMFRSITPERNVAFVSLWDNYPHALSFPVENRQGRVLSLLVCGTTNVMQGHIANAAIYLHYDDGTTDSLMLTPPENYWNLCPITSTASAPGQGGRYYYYSTIDRFCMPARFPETVSLGRNCTALLLAHRLLPGKTLSNITLRCLSQEVVVGLMGISIGQ